MISVRHAPRVDRRSWRNVARLLGILWVVLIPKTGYAAVDRDPALHDEVQRLLATYDELTKKAARRFVSKADLVVRDVEMYRFFKTTEAVLLSFEDRLAKLEQAEHARKARTVSPWDGTGSGDSTRSR